MGKAIKTGTFKIVNENDCFFNVYNTRTNLLVAKFDAEDRKINFTDKDSSFTQDDLDELWSFINSISIILKTKH